MSGLEVIIGPSTPAGRIYPRYVSTAGILAVGSREPRPWVYGVDIDGRLVFDLDSDRRLVNFDLHIPRARWQAQAINSVAVIGRPGDLLFSPNTTRAKSFGIDLDTKWDSPTRTLLILIGHAKFDVAVALSEQCMGLVADNQLVGFQITGIEV